MTTMLLAGLAVALVDAARDADAAGVRDGASLAVRVDRMEVEMPVELRVYGRCVAVRLPGLREAAHPAPRFARLRVTIGGGG
jgi:hypothetical protein